MIFGVLMSTDCLWFLVLTKTLYSQQDKWISYPASCDPDASSADPFANRANPQASSLPECLFQNASSGEDFSHLYSFYGYRSVCRLLIHDWTYRFLLLLCGLKSSPKFLNPSSMIYPQQLKESKSLLLPSSPSVFPLFLFFFFHT